MFDPNDLIPDLAFSTPFVTPVLNVSPSLDALEFTLSRLTCPRSERASFVALASEETFERSAVSTFWEDDIFFLRFEISSTASVSLIFETLSDRPI